MSVDIRDLLAFYASPLGMVARRYVGRAIDRIWPDLAGRDVLGLGYATPYLDAYGQNRGRSRRALAFMPAGLGVVRWLGVAGSRSALVDPLMLPLPDGAFDRVLVVHALETVSDPSELLREVARVLAPGGRVLLVCPNRRGLWARLDTTPFGYGQPFSRSQLRELMRGVSLAPERWAETLYMPPLASRMLLRGAGAWEALGSRLSLPFAGLHVVEAAQLLLRPEPVMVTTRAVRRSPILVPAAASARSVLQRTRQ